MAVRHIAGAVVLLVLVLTGCSTDDGGDPERDRRIAEALGESSEDATSNGWSEEDFEYKFAVAGEQRGRLDVNDPIIDTYARALDDAEQVCTEGRERIGDIAVGTVQILDDELGAHDQTALSVLREITSAAEGITTECSGLAAVFIALMVDR